MHATNRVVHGDTQADVDEYLAPLVLEMWRAGIETVGSCQDGGDSLRDLVERLPALEAYARNSVGRAYLQFGDPAPLCEFFEALANAGPRDGFYERMTHWAATDAWRASVSMVDALADEDEPDWTGRSHFYPSTLHLEFPTCDIHEMTRRMTAHNMGLAGPGGEPTSPTTSVPDDSTP